MSRPMIVADRAIPYLEEAFAPYADLCLLPGSTIGPDDVRGADALVVRTRTRCDRDLLAGSRVRLVATATIGTDHIDREWCRGAGIEVADAAGCNARGVLQWVAAVLVALARRDGWAESPAGRTLGVVGTGHVGGLVAEYGRAWGFTVLCSDPPRERAEGLGRAEGYVALDELTARSDIVTFHVPLTHSGPCPTRGMADAAFLARLRPGAALLNASRGGVADEGALGTAMTQRALRVALDTWCGEPRIDRSLLDRAFIATPHVAGYTLQGKANGTALAVRAVARRFALPPTDYYPDGVPASAPRPIGWSELVATIGRYCDPIAETRTLRARPDDFEHLRETYPLRTEYF